MKFLKLVNTNICAQVDDEDYQLCVRHIWYLAIRKNDLKYAYAKINNNIVFLHNLIMPTVKAGIIVDHKDNDGLNNQKFNLRYATYSQNNTNRRHNRINFVSKYRGVTKKQSTGKYLAQISVRGKNIHLGYFETEEMAARAYNLASKRYYGEFANLNILDSSNGKGGAEIHGTIN